MNERVVSKVAAGAALDRADKVEKTQPNFWS